MTYVSTVLADGPLHFWRFADPGGALCHDIGSSPAHMRGVGGSPVLGYSGVASDGGSIDLSLTGFYVNSGTNYVCPTAACSVECWVWLFQNIAGTGAFLVVHSATQVGLFRISSQWQMAYNGVGANSVSNFTAHAWHHLVGTFDGANLRLYVDGALSTTVAAAPQVAAAELLIAGSRAALDIWGQCFMAEASVYSTALSAAQVAAHYNAADTKGYDPVFQQAGSFATATGAGSPLSTQLAGGLSRTWSNTP